MGAVTDDVSGNSLSFSSIEILSGNDDIDRFSLNTDQFTGQINGGDGSDRLTASVGDNTWAITGSDQGAVTDLATTNVVSFSAIENITGNTGTDHFIFSNSSADIAGVIDGGSQSIDQSDQVDLSNLAIVDVTIGTAISNTGVNIIDIEQVTGNDDASTDNSTIRGESTVAANNQNSWIIFDDTTEADPFDTLINDGRVTNEHGEVAFNNFSSVIGSDRDDSFMFSGVGVADMSIAGGVDDPLDDNDRIDFSNQSGAVSVSLGQDFFNGILYIEGVTGNNTVSTINGSLTDTNSWIINGNNSGEIVAGSQRLTFTGFNFLMAGDQGDTFNVNSGGSIGTIVTNTLAGSIQGGAGDDTLNITLTGTESNNNPLAFYGLEFNAGNGLNDTVNTLGNGATYDDASYSVNNTRTSASHVYQDSDSSFSLTYTGVEAVNDDVRATALIINGTSEQDSINLQHGASNGQFTVSSGPVPIVYTTVDYSNKIHLQIVTGASGADSVTLTGNLDLGAGNLSILSAETLDRGNDLYQISAASILLDGLIVMGTENSAFNINADTLDIRNSNNTTTAIYLQEADTLTLAGINEHGLLNLTAQDTLLSSAALVSSAELQLTSIAGDIELINDNGLAGRLSLNADAGDITLNNAVTTILDSVSTNELTITSTSTITDAENGIIIASTAIFDAANSAIELDNALNAFDALTINQAQSAVIQDNAGGLVLNNISIDSGLLNISSNGITQATGTAITQLANTAGIADDVVFNANAGDITLDGNNQFTGSVTLNNTDANDVTISDIDSIDFALVTIGSGGFTVNATGITQSGAIMQAATAGDVRLNAGNGDIGLDNPGNDFTGDVLLTTTNTPGTRVGQVSLVDANTLQLGTSSIGGALDVTVLAGDLTQSGVLNVLGDASFLVADGQSITLQEPANHFQQGVSFDAISGQLLDVGITNITALDLADISVSHDLVVNAQGEITNSGILQVGNIASIDANGNSITLQNPQNDFNDIVLHTANNVDIHDIDNIAFNQTSTISGDLNITTTNGQVTDRTGSVLSVAGVTGIQTGGVNDIDLSAGTNDFSSLHIVTANNVKLNDINAISLGATAIIGTLDVVAGGNITGSTHALNVNGNASFTAADASVVTLDNSGNNLSGDLSFNAATGRLNTITLINNQDTSLLNVDVSQDLNIVSAGAIIDGDSGAIVVDGLTTLSATSSGIEQDIFLDNLATSNNNFNDIIVLAAGTISISDIDDLMILSVTAAKIASFKAGADVSISQINAGETISVTTINGRISGFNGAGANLVAERIELTANNGIGLNNAALLTEASQYAIENNQSGIGSGVINLSNSGDLTLHRVHNSGDIFLNNSTDYIFKPGSIDSDRSVGNLTMITNSGDFIGFGPFDPTTNPADITAANATFIGSLSSSSFGSPVRPLVLDVPSTGSVLVIVRNSTQPLFLPETPNFDDSNSLFSISLNVASAVAGEQLVEVESLGEIDPAIFTDLQNYSLQEISIRLPQDQLFEDELEEYERELGAIKPSW